MEGNVQRKDVLSNVLVFLDLKGKDARERVFKLIYCHFNCVYNFSRKRFLHVIFLIPEIHD
jgi:hypothetical protein